MLFSFARRARIPLAVGGAAYLAATAAVCAATGYALWEGSTALLARLAPEATSARGIAAAKPTPAAEPKAIRTVRREGAMTPLAERDGRRIQRWELAQSAQFGTSTRSPYQSYGTPRASEWGDEDYDDRPREVRTFRTLCVRLCDGYYFPVSFAVTADRLSRDRDVCSSRCGAQGRLFVHRSMDTSTDDMVDLQGRPYRNLPTAFLYRTQYVSDCKCQPEPWDAASLNRHRAYALAASARKGNKDAAKELVTLQAKIKEDAKAAAAKAPPPGVYGVAGGAPNPAAAARQAEIAKRNEDGNIMMLGGDSGAKPKRDGSQPAVPSRRDADWLQRTFDPGANGR